MDKPDITELSSELTYHRYMFNQERVASLFSEISVQEYIALHRIYGSVSKNGGAGKTYLTDIAKELHISVAKASKTVGNLRDKGVILWEHDGNGEDGTYVTITKAGEQLINRQEETLKAYYGRVIERFGKEKLISLFSLLKEFEDAMDSELKEESE